MVEPVATPNTDRRWFSDGASMAYPLRQRLTYWLINLGLYALLNMFYLRLHSGVWVKFGPYHSGALIDQLLGPLNVFHFPSQILVTGLIMALLCAVPILTAQLYNFLCSIPFVAAVFFLGHNPVLSLCLLASCLAAGFDPLRFKSKFVAAVLCLLPEVLYWVLFFGGANPEQDARRWAILYAPWALAFFVCVLLFGVVLLVGHFLRYRPGVLMPLFAALLAAAVLVFNLTIGMEERDFQAQVYQFSPSRIRELQPRSIRGLIEKELIERTKQFPYVNPEVLEQRLRLEWHWAFRISPRPGDTVLSGNLESWGEPSQARKEVGQFVEAQVNAIDHIDEFIEGHQVTPRHADAYYYKALLFDLNVDQRSLRDEDRLEFYYDRPSLASQGVWEKILEDFPESAPAIEARYRLAFLQAARQPATPEEGFQFNTARELLDEAARRAEALLQHRHQAEVSAAAEKAWFGIAALFTPPPGGLSNQELLDLHQRTARLRLLISKENRTGHLQNEQRLATFVALDPHQLAYERRLTDLLHDAPAGDPLRDNIELALARVETDPAVRMARLAELAGHNADRDGGVEAMLDLALMLLDQRNRTKHVGTVQSLHEESQQYLQQIIARRPGTYLAQQAQQLLERNPLE